jgi:hypothetical protein
LSVVCCLLSVVCCLLSVVCCLLSAVCWYALEVNAKIRDMRESWTCVTLVVFRTVHVFAHSMLMRVPDNGTHTITIECCKKDDDGVRSTTAL